MMECDETIHYIEEAELALETLRRFWHRKQKSSVLATAAFAFAHMQQEFEGSDALFTQFGELIRIALWIEDLRCGLDPRCNLCKQAGPLKSNSQNSIPEVLQ